MKVQYKNVMLNINECLTLGMNDFTLFINRMIITIVLLGYFNV